MRRLMMEMKPTRFDHIMVAISLYRPGPMVSIPEYIKRMHSSIYEDNDIVEYHTPQLEPILQETYGILVYQEQIIRIASDLAGYAPGEADMLRKAVAKKKQKLMEEHQLKFTEGAVERGISRQICNSIWGEIEYFARYGFNKAHAADYAMVTCQTAFLKAHYPVEYLAAMLSVERDNTDKVRRYFSEARNLGINIAPPDINQSGLDFTIEDQDQKQAIRFGLGAIKNAGESALMIVLEDREANGPFEGLQELCDRVDLRRVGKRTLEYMVKARAFESWGSVPQFLEGLDRIMAESGRTHQAAAVGQMSLFGSSLGAGGLKMNADLLKSAAELKEIEHRKLLEWEKEALGVHVSEHPMERLLATIKSRTNVVIGEIVKNMNGKIIRVAGMISTLRTLTTKKGDPMAFGTLEDLDDKIDLVFFPRTWEKHRQQVQVDQVMLVIGKVQVKDDQVNIIVDRVVTKLETAQAADLTDHSFSPPPIKSNGGSHHPGRERSSQSAQKETIATPASLPPIDSAQGPPPPPNFEEDGSQPLGNEQIEQPQRDVQAAAPLLESTKPGAAEESYIARSGEVIEVPGNGNHRAHTIVVEIKPVGNWQETCRRTVKTVKDFPGQDNLKLRFPGQTFSMNFLEGGIDFCDDLIESLERIPGIIRVYGR